jgi:hypothetical protein
LNVSGAAVGYAAFLLARAVYRRAVRPSHA